MEFNNIGFIPKFIVSGWNQSDYSDLPLIWIHFQLKAKLFLQLQSQIPYQLRIPQWQKSCLDLHRSDVKGRRSGLMMIRLWIFQKMKVKLLSVTLLAEETYFFPSLVESDIWLLLERLSRPRVFTHSFQGNSSLFLGHCITLQVCRCCKIVLHDEADWVTGDKF